MASTPKTGFRHLSWRFSRKSFLLLLILFIVLFAFNSGIVHYSLRHPLLKPSQDRIEQAIHSIEVDLNQQTQDLLALQADINKIQTVSETQRKALQTMRQDLDRASGRLSLLSREIDEMLNSNNDVPRSLEYQKAALQRIQSSLADVKMHVQELHDALMVK